MEILPLSQMNNNVTINGNGSTNGNNSRPSSYKSKRDRNIDCMF